MDFKTIYGYHHLPKDRYNVQERLAMSASITARYKNMQESVQRKDKHSDKYKFHFYTSRVVYDTLDSMLLSDAQNYHDIYKIMNALSIYTTNSKYKNFVGGLLHVTVLHASEEKPTETISVSAVAVNSVIFHNLIYNVDKLQDVLSDLRLGILRDVDLLPARNIGQDGQMKIMVDAILAVDALEDKDSVKLLVMGSGHEPLAHPRYAYAPVTHMLEHSQIDLYDYVEEQGVTKEGTNFVERYSEGAPLEKAKTYDLVLDDVWANNKTTIQMDKMRNFMIQDIYPENFSVKSFLYRLDEANVYYQCAYTKSSEVRLVSRPIFPKYRHNKLLGDCVYCRELKFFLKNDYPISFYLSVMMTHLKPCKVPELNLMNQYYNKKKTRVESLEWEKVASVGFHTEGELLERRKFKMKEITIRGKKLRRLVVDKELSYPPVEYRAELLSLVDVVVSDDYFVTLMLFENAANIYKVRGRDFYVLKREKKGIVLNEKDDVKTHLHRGYNK